MVAAREGPARGRDATARPDPFWSDGDVLMTIEPLRWMSPSRDAVACACGGPPVVVAEVARRETRNAPTVDSVRPRSPAASRPRASWTTLGRVREVEIAHEHVARIDPSPITRVVVALERPAADPGYADHLLSGRLDC